MKTWWLSVVQALKRLSIHGCSQAFKLPSFQAPELPSSRASVKLGKERIKSLTRRKERKRRMTKILAETLPLLEDKQGSNPVHKECDYT